MEGERNVGRYEDTDEYKKSESIKEDILNSIDALINNMLKDGQVMEYLSKSENETEQEIGDMLSSIYKKLTVVRSNIEEIKTNPEYKFSSANSLFHELRNFSFFKLLIVRKINGQSCPLNVEDFLLHAQNLYDYLSERAGDKELLKKDLATDHLKETHKK